MWKDNLNQKISSKSACWNQQSIGEGIDNWKLSKLRQEQGQYSSVNEEEKYCKPQTEMKQLEKNYKLTKSQNFQYLNGEFDQLKQLPSKNPNSSVRQNVKRELSLSDSKNLKQSKNQQKENLSSIIQNLGSSKFERSNSSYTSLNNSQEVCVNKASYNVQILHQQKQENKQVPYQSSFSSLGTISEESSQKSQSSQYLSPIEGNFTKSSLNLYDKEDKTDQDISEEKVEKESEYAMVLISCLVVLALSYLYLIIAT